jgi:hypothetical protein
VLKALQRLPEPWVVLDSVAWQSPREGREGDGEADVVAIHPEVGMVVMEVKGGGVEIDAGRWFSTDRNGIRHPIKSPFEQAVGSKHALIRFLRDSGVITSHVAAGHAVVFPDLADLSSLGPAATPHVTWTGRDIGDPKRAMAGLSVHWNMSSSMSKASVESIIAQLAPTVAFHPLLRDRVAASVRDLVRLTEEQVRVLEGLRRARRAVIYGGAGTGKTVLAVERTRRLADEGFRVLLTCFNRPLGDHLKACLSDDERITVSSFHALALTEVQRAGGAPPQVRDARWWDMELPSALPDAALKNGTTFDAVVVDEGQDFDSTWWTVLSLLLADPDAGPFYVFADAQQAIYRASWEPPFAGLEFDLTINCRNTLPIAERVAAVFDDRRPKSLGASGPEPRIHVIRGFPEVGGVLKDALHRLLVKEQLEPAQIVILSTTKDVVDTARARRFGNHRVVAAGEEGIVAETVHRFKGLEADAVLLVALEPGREAQALMYIGLSRPRAYLELICTPEVASAVRWTGEGGN